MLHVESFSSHCKDIEDKQYDQSAPSPQPYNSGSVFDTPKAASSFDTYFTMQFSFEDLKAKRKERLSRLRFCKNTFGNVKVKRF